MSEQFRICGHTYIDMQASNDPRITNVLKSYVVYHEFINKNTKGRIFSIW